MRTSTSCGSRSRARPSAALARDVRRTLATREDWDRRGRAENDDPPTPRWMSEEDLAVYVREYERTGFRAGLSRTATSIATGA